MEDNRLMEGIRQTGGQDVPHAADTGTRPISVGWFQISGVHQYLSGAQRLKHTNMAKIMLVSVIDLKSPEGLVVRKQARKLGRCDNSVESRVKFLWGFFWLIFFVCFIFCFFNVLFFCFVLLCWVILVCIDITKEMVYNFF